MMLGQGAEAIVTKKGSAVQKVRPKKGYRLEVIDIKLRSQRTRREAKIMEKLGKAKVPVPVLAKVDDKKMEIDMSFLDGPKLRDVLDKSPKLAKEFGKLVGMMHAEDVVHGDLTTSNVIRANNKLHLIDFGLSFVSTKVEDKAVDLHVLNCALESTHFALPDAFESVIAGYKEDNKGHSVVLERLEVVRARGRNKK